MASKWYNNGLLALFEGEIDVGTTDIRVLLVESGYTFDKAHNDVDDITNECTGTGYSRKALTSMTAGVLSNVAEMKAAAVTWTGADFGTPAGAVIYKYNASDADARLLCFCDQNDLITNGGDYTLEFNSADPGRIAGLDNTA
jgi:hypothetical protein